MGCVGLRRRGNDALRDVMPEICWNGARFQCMSGYPAREVSMNLLFGRRLVPKVLKGFLPVLNDRHGVAAKRQG